jgi:hypothetical protein
MGLFWRNKKNVGVAIKLKDLSSVERRGPPAPK